MDPRASAFCKDSPCADSGSPYYSKLPTENHCLTGKKAFYVY